MSSILIVEDEAPLRQSLNIALRRAGHEVADAGTVAEAQRLLEHEIFDLVVLDLRLPDGDGMTLLTAVRSLRPETAVIMMTAYGSVNVAVEAMRVGASDFIEKPFGHERLVATVDRALEHSRLRAELRRRSEQAAADIVGDSPAMQEVRNRVRQAADARVVLVTGETGTGKNLVARAIHAERDAELPFVVVHCGSLPDTIDSELFGHVRGAFPGADARRGMLREAEGGTVFFDEIATIPAELQPKLLRFLDEGEIRPVGADRTIRTRCRVVVATSRDLAAEVKAGKMRQDLLHRLDVFRIALPPLRERIEDLPRLAEHLLARVGSRLGRPTLRIDEAALDVLRAHDWPGNVRELEHALERALLLADDGTLTADLLEPFVEEASAADSAEIETAPEGRDSTTPPLATIEREHILRVLEAMDGDRTATAKALGISRSTLRRKLISYDRWTTGRVEAPEDDRGSGSN